VVLIERKSIFEVYATDYHVVVAVPLNTSVKDDLIELAGLTSRLTLL